MKYILFTTPMCPNCPPMKEFVKDLDVEMVDASTPEGLEKAQKMNVSSVPTLIAMDGDEEKGRGHTVEEVKNLVK